MTPEFAHYALLSKFSPDGDDATLPCGMSQLSERSKGSGDSNELAS